MFIVSASANLVRRLTVLDRGRAVLSLEAASFISVVLLSWLGAGYFFAPPVFSFRVDDPLNVVAIVAFLTTSLVITRLVSRVRKLADEALSSVSHKVIEAEEQERQRIARDLHEDIGQRLALLAIEIEQIKLASLNPTADMTSRIDGVLKRQLEILTDVKASAHELHSPRLEYLDIAGVMRSFCKEFGRSERGCKLTSRATTYPTTSRRTLRLSLPCAAGGAAQRGESASGALRRVRWTFVGKHGGDSSHGRRLRYVRGLASRPAMQARGLGHQPHAGAAETREGNSFHRFATQARDHDPRSRAFPFRKM